MSKLAGLTLLSALASVVSAAPTPGRAAELRHLVRNDCGACHGITLKGGLGSPLTRLALADKPATSLVATILDGRPGTPMPPWRPFLSEEEAQWIVQWLKQGAPE